MSSYRDITEKTINSPVLARGLGKDALRPEGFLGRLYAPMPFKSVVHSSRKTEEQRTIVLDVGDGSVKEDKNKVRSEVFAVQF